MAGTVAADVWIVGRGESYAELRMLGDELGGRGLRAEVVDWDGLTPSCEPPGALRADGGFQVPRLAVIGSMVFTRQPAAGLADLQAALGLLEDGGARLVNPAASLAAYRNKLRQTAALAAAGLPVPPTRAARSVAQVSACVAEWGDVVVKPSYGHASVDVLRLRPGVHGGEVPGGLGRRSGILVWHLLDRHGVLCVQRFVTNPGRDLRLVVLGGRVAACYYHVSTAPDGDTHHPLYPFRWERAERKPEIEELALRAVAVLGFDVASLDLLEGPDGPVVVEVNPSVSAWASVERTEYDRTPDGITRAYADLLCERLAERA
ncbi:RimK family alpha-L-glutamate ligase [Kitasatospora sp. NPDC092039]|uniref:ATP-grasp domain-containing protein n=1 Tax=Kitasatospora sp. NPDC092039 TaxID=3364086 RepID=UPI0038042D28